MSHDLGYQKIIPCLPQTSLLGGKSTRVSSLEQHRLPWSQEWECAGLEVSPLLVVQDTEDVPLQWCLPLEWYLLLRRPLFCPLSRLTSLLSDSLLHSAWAKCNSSWATTAFPGKVSNNNFELNTCCPPSILSWLFNNCIEGQPSGDLKGFGGTEGFMAPEIVKWNGEEEYSLKVSELKESRMWMSI